MTTTTFCFHLYHLLDTILTIRYGIPNCLLNSSAFPIISSNIFHDSLSCGDVIQNCSTYNIEKKNEYAVILTIREINY